MNGLNPPRRVRCKMATGSGKTVVMEMLVASGFCNRGISAGASSRARCWSVSEFDGEGRSQMLRPERRLVAENPMLNRRAEGRHRLTKAASDELQARPLCPTGGSRQCGKMLALEG
jgi:hypothetical protein